MEEDRRQGWRQSAALRSAALLLLLVSPVGAPIVGLIILKACEVPFEGSFQCAVPTPLLDYFLPFIVLPLVWLGPFMAILWLMLSAAVLLGCLYYAAKAVWDATRERP